MRIGHVWTTTKKRRTRLKVGSKFQIVCFPIESFLYSIPAFGETRVGEGDLGIGFEPLVSFPQTRPSQMLFFKLAADHVGNCHGYFTWIYCNSSTKLSVFYHFLQVQIYIYSIFYSSSFCDFQESNRYWICLHLTYIICDFKEWVFGWEAYQIINMLQGKFRVRAKAKGWSGFLINACRQSKFLTVCLIIS